MTTLDEYGTEFPPEIGNVARRELAVNGLVTYDQLAGTSRHTLLAIHGVGPKAVRILGEELARRGQSFADD
jgi:predicted flap endonuclease-1-like 5' DNA nuclease